MRRAPSTTGQLGHRASDGATLLDPRTATTFRASEGSLRVRLEGPALALLSAGLLWTSFPAHAVPPLVWVGLVPLMWLVWSAHSWRWVYLSAWLGGLVFFGASVHWLRYTDDKGYFGWLGLALYLSLYFPLFVFLVRLAVRRGRVPVVLVVPVVWVALELLRAYFLTGFAWFFLAHTQYRWLALIQISDVTGAYGVSFVIALVNAAIAQAIRGLVESRALTLLRVESRGSTAESPKAARTCRWAFDARSARVAVPLGLAGVVVIGALVYGHLRLAHSEFEPGPTVALLQSNVPQRFKEDPAKAHANYSELLHLLAEAKRHHPDLVVWPETSWPYIPLVYIAPETSDAAFETLGGEDTPADWRRWSQEVQQAVGRLAAQVGRPMLVGALVYDFRPAGLRRYNSAVLVEPGGNLSPRYDKLHLVAFGEYLPLAGWMPWLHILTPYETATYSLDTGSDPVRFSLGRYRFASVICFEDTVPHLVRRFMKPEGAKSRVEGQQAAVDFLVNMTNDGWFGGSSELDQHLATSVFRAVECRRPLVRAVNTGISAIIDGDGRIRQQARDPETGRSKMIADVVVGAVPLDARGSVYAAVGDVFGVMCVGLTVAFCAIGYRGRRRAVSP